MVSLMTRRVPQAKLERFYGCLRTPVSLGEPETAPFTLPQGTEPAPRRVVFDRFELEIPRISRVGIVGVVVASALVGVLLAVVYWIFTLGT